MRRAPRSEPPFDPRWLDLLAERCSDLRGGGSRFEDFYLEQRLELRAVTTSSGLRFEECRLEGAAARWRSPSKLVLHSRTGLSTTAFSELLARQADRVALPSGRTVPTPEMDPPRGWIDWARSVASRLAPSPTIVRYLHRRAAVVRAGGWVPVSSPALVRIERMGYRPSALLAVWGHPRLGSWLGELMAEPPAKLWEPTPGTHFPVLFMNGSAGILMHELVGHMAESDLVASGASPLAQLAGATITAPTIRIVDDPTRFDLPGGFDHDDEAVPAEPIPVVTNGRLANFLCDGEGARQLAAPPGRGRRAVWSRLPVARLSNLVVSAGKHLAEELEGDLEHGIVVTRIGGATVDPVSSRTVLRVERGWEIRHGRRRRSLAPCELTGNVMEILTRIDPRIGADPATDWRLGWCVKDGVPLPTGSEAPSVLVESLEVL